MKNKLKVTIYNKNYNLVSEETQEYTDILAEKIDSGIRQLLLSAPCLSVQEASVLFALDCADELTKTKQNMENIRSQIKGYVDDAAQARHEADEVKKENSLLRQKIEKLELELRMQTTIVRNDDEEFLSAKDIISQDIKDIIDSPVHEEPVVQREKKPAPKIVNASQFDNSNHNNKTYIGQMNYNPNGGNK